MLSTPQIVDAEHIEAVEVAEHGEDGASEVLNNISNPQRVDCSTH